MLPESIIDANRTAQITDDAWGNELRKQFGKRAGDIRYTPQGRGEPGSDLRKLYDAREAARIAHDRARGYDARGKRIPPLLPLIDDAVNLLLLKDGDRDHMNHSAITCEQSMAVVEVLRRCREYFA